MVGNLLTIQADNVALIVAQVRSGVPEEVCGFLAGTRDRVNKVYSVANVAEDRHTRFLMDPMQQVTALIDIKRRGWDVLAVYHSHPPGARPDPSPIDLAQNTYPSALTVIAVPDLVKECVWLRAFSVDGGKVRAVDIGIIAEDNQTIARSIEWCY